MKLVIARLGHLRLRSERFAETNTFSYEAPPCAVLSFPSPIYAQASISSRKLKFLLDDAHLYKL